MLARTNLLKHFVSEYDSVRTNLLGINIISLCQDLLIGEFILSEKACFYIIKFQHRNLHAKVLWGDMEIWSCLFLRRCWSHMIRLSFRIETWGSKRSKKIWNGCWRELGQKGWFSRSAMGVGISLTPAPMQITVCQRLGHAIHHPPAQNRSEYMYWLFGIMV